VSKPELLAPAGSLEKGKIALLYGADAIYLGGKAFGLRAFAANFSLEEIREMTAFAHKLGRKVYVTVNIVPHDEDLPGLPQYLKDLEDAQVDGLLISDLGVWAIARKTVDQSKVELHVSTQANVTNSAAAKAWEDLGADRVVLARELSIPEIAQIHQNVKADLEVFVHGAMCISHSGRCLLSNYFTGRDSNRGACAQVCRWEFSLVEKNRPGQAFDIAEDERGTYIMNSKDLCLIDHLPELMAAGVRSLKIEGRMKSITTWPRWSASTGRPLTPATQTRSIIRCRKPGGRNWRKCPTGPTPRALPWGSRDRKTRYTARLPMNRLQILWASFRAMTRKRAG